MTTTPDDSATAWRDLADQLKPTQLDKLAELEADSTSDAAETASALLEVARGWATANTAASVLFDGLPVPPDARRVAIEQVRDDDWLRTFDGTERVVDGVEIHVLGRQDADGRTTRAITIEATGEYDAETTRRIAVALVAAAKEIEALK